MIEPRVYIIILNYKTWEDTIECLESVYKLHYSNFKVVVVDNDSTNDSVNKIKDWADGLIEVKPKNESLFNKLLTPVSKKPIQFSFNEPNQLTIIKASQNNGYSAGNNIGISFGLKQNDADYFWLLNNDVIVEANSLNFLIEKAKFYRHTNSRVGIIGSKVMYYHRPNIIQCAGGAKFNKYTTFGKQIGGGEDDQNQWDIEELKDLGMISGACCFVDKQFVVEVGLLAEEYFLYFEEMDWAQRGFKLGWNLGYSYQSRIYHKEGQTTGGGDKIKVKTISKFSDFYFNRSRIIFSRKFNSFFGLSVTYFVMLLVIINRIRKFQFDRAILFLKLLFKHDYKFIK